jgi:hypothetical protein
VGRELCEAEILYSENYPPLRRLVRHLSEEGLLLEEVMIVPGGVPVRVRLRLPGARGPLLLRGLAEARPDSGSCTVRFTHVPPAARLAIKQFLEARRP